MLSTRPFHGVQFWLCCTVTRLFQVLLGRKEGRKEGRSAFSERDNDVIPRLLMTIAEEEHTPGSNDHNVAIMELRIDTVIKTIKVKGDSMPSDLKEELDGTWTEMQSTFLQEREATRRFVHTCHSLRAMKCTVAVAV